MDSEAHDAPPGAWPLPAPPGASGPQATAADGRAAGATPDRGASPRSAALGGRLHPAFIVIQSLRQVVPLVFVAFAGPFALPVVVGALVVGLGASAVTWYRFTWRITADALVIEQGLLQRRRRVIPLGRIQSVERVRALRHRLVGVVALRVESIGGDDTEGQLDALDPALAERVRAALLRRDAPTREVADEPSGDVLVRVPARQLVVAGLTGGRVGVAAAIVGFAQQVFGDEIFGETVVTRLLESRDASQLRTVAVVVVLAAVVVFALSVAATALTFWDFTVAREGAELAIRRGLLEQRADTVPVERIQAVRVEQNLLRRMLGLATVRIEVAGRSGSTSARRTSDVLLPIGSLPAADALADAVMSSQVAATPLTPMPAGARRRRVVRAVALGVAPALLGLVDARAVALALLVIPSVAAALASYRALGWAMTSSHVLARSGVLLRRRWIVPTAAVQSVARTSTPFQRRRDLATVTLHIARSGGAGSPAIIDVSGADARDVTRHLAAASVEAGRRQMAGRRARRRAAEAG